MGHPHAGGDKGEEVGEAHGSYQPNSLPKAEAPFASGLIRVVP